MIFQNAMARSDVYKTNIYWEAREGGKREYESEVLKASSLERSPGIACHVSWRAF